MEEEDEDICRVCRATGSPDDPLFHPCICTGSIRHVHQDCLVQWLRHSRKEYCELCNHKYTFKPIYSPDMPNHLPLHDLFFGLVKSIFTAVKHWIHYTVVAIAWLVVVPLTASRIYNCVFAGSVSALTALPQNMISTAHIGKDVFHGYGVVACTMGTFVCLVWLRVQLLNGDMPVWLIPQHHEPVADVEPQNPEPNEADDDAQIVEENPVDDNNNANEPEAPQNEPPAQLQNIGANINWNAVEWDRGEDPTWERILGLDGSLLFIEHIFWVIALNTLFILVFAFCPYHLGHFFMLSCNLNHYVVATKFEGVLTTLCGYIIVAFSFLCGHVIMHITRLRWPLGWIFGIGYIILKVGLLVIIELGIFPLLCGVWIDVCTLKAFNSTLQDRQEVYLKSPTVSIFMHWLVGIVFVFYFATFLMLLREVLRPGALWFFRNLNDPNFNPINEMIHIPVFRHFRRFLLSTIIFGCTIIIIAWLPVQLLLFVAPNFLPYNGSIPPYPLGEFPMQLCALQFIASGILEQTNIRVWFKASVKWWAHVIGSLLGVRSYLLGDDDVVPLRNGDLVEGQNNLNEIPLGRQNGAAGLGQEINLYRPYTKPAYFSTRIVMLLVLLAATVTLLFTAILSIPVYMGRATVSFLFGSKGIVFKTPSNNPYVMYELYTFLMGFYLFWACARFYHMMTTWAPRGRRIIKEKIIDGLKTIFKACVLSFFVVGLIPLLLGIIFDLTIILPLRVYLHQSPVFALWQDWAIGIFAFKLVIGVLLIGPATWLQENVDRAYHNGLRQLNLLDFLSGTVMPVVVFLVLLLAVPYFVGHTIPRLWNCDEYVENFMKWRFHSIMIIVGGFMQLCWYEIKQFKRLCERIKNERYLIGRRLQDYDPQSTAA